VLKLQQETHLQSVLKPDTDFIWAEMVHKNRARKDYAGENPKLANK
jgi:hypothetical protein